MSALSSNFRVDVCVYTNTYRANHNFLTSIGLLFSIFINIHLYLLNHFFPICNYRIRYPGGATTPCGTNPNPNITNSNHGGNLGNLATIVADSTSPRPMNGRQYRR